ncbi:DMT family transporter [Paraburkholderia rhizosphaerae]|uniref:EamA domain-containing membrane protein RarD n=1 Tax=Paraburkholderia rhizosphaerae TaxID=480658 RepID=A0A4R8LYD4_9BURK|nr:DMT family transporter [Paraburkholderia rhizosphaerae]TDY53393.1 EamA domain-containing membrane protein RarD [Paraburkholderia rhizosphaerae]
MTANGMKRAAATAAADERMGQAYMFGAMVIAGTIGYFVVLSGQHPFNVVFFRCAIGMLGLAAYCWHKGFFRGLRIDCGQLLNLTLGALTLIFNWYFLFTAYGLTSIGITTVVYNVQPFLLVVAGMLIRKERPARAALFWLVVAFCGVVILAQPATAHPSPAYLLGIGSALAAAALYATTTLLTKSLATTLRPEVIAVCHMAIGTLAFIPLADFHRLPVAGHQVFAIAALGLVHTTFMYVLLYGAFKKAFTTSIAVLGFVYPLVAVIVDFLAYGKLMNGEQIFGGALILLAAMMYATGVGARGGRATGGVEIGEARRQKR